jgi:hypothetical protein
MSSRLCVLPTCLQPGGHFDDCDSDRCRGCRPRYVERGLVCNSDRAGLAETLTELVKLWGELTGLPPTGVGHQGQAAKVSGSREAPVPLNLDLLDLTAPARNGSVIVPRDHDQTGHLALPTELDVWVRDWRETRAMGEHPPAPTVVGLVGWLANRLDWACDHHDAIDEFAADIRRLRKAMRRMLHLDAVIRERCDGVACKSCDRMALYRENGLVSCGYCGLHYSEREYRDWVKLEAPYALSLVRDGEVVPNNPDELRRMAA